MRNILGNWQAHLAYMVAGFKDNLAYKSDLAISLVFRFSASAIMILVWTAIYLTTGRAEIGGYTILSMYVYFFIVNAIFTMIDMDIDGAMQQAIYSGNLTTSMLRPVNYIAQVFFYSLPETILQVAFVSVPLIVIAALISHMAVSMATALLTFAELLLGFSILNTVFFMMGTLAVYTTNVWGASGLVYYIFQILGGAYVPLNLFPKALQGFIALTPFQFIAYAPAATLLGVITTGAAIQNIFVGIVWAAAIMLFAAYWWGHIKKRVSFVGG